MLCRVADADAVADELSWEPIHGSAKSGARPKSSPVPLSSADRRSAEAHDGTEIASLRRQLAELETRRSQELEQARQGGFEQGVSHCRQEAAGETEKILDRLARAIQEVAQVKRKARAEAETELVKLSLAIARRILHREVNVDPQALQGVVHAALQRLQNREINRIRVFPAAASAVRAALERNGGIAAVEISSDPSLPSGGLLFETSLGELDASIETQLQEVERGFIDRLQIR